ncbi:hypothetical protein VZT92_013510 [Zoarces viviparus]|uniref:Uncharacterized protein n=1 Tax=Zoarces viviparus TaxID=48416 RepID=A0AAW1F3E5_ZOAVI
MRQKGALGVTKVERAVYGTAEDSRSVNAAPFSRPVRPVFVMSDVSIKTRAAIRNHPPHPSRRPDCHRDPRAPPGSAPPFTRDPAPDSLCLSFPPSF